jgi:DNA-binding NtrC family response regulator
MSLDDVEKNHILRTLAYHQGNKTRTAQSLGVTIKTLYNKLHRYGILKTPSLGG